MKKNFLIFLLLPVLSTSQPLQFQLQPGAFSAEINGWQMMQPWSGGKDATTPEFWDIDEDGDKDIFLGKKGSYISYFHNVGSPVQPNFLYMTSFYDSLKNLYENNDCSDIEFIDINSDGKEEAFIGGACIYLYNNYGTPSQPNFLGLPNILYDIDSVLIVGTHISLVDINQDGDYDLFAGHYTGYLKYYQNVGTVTNYAFQLNSSNWFNTYTNQGYADPCFTDLDGDGDLDLLIGTGQGNIYYYSNEGTATNPQMVYVTNNFCNIDVGEDASPELVDIDGDSDFDLFVGRNPNSATASVTQGDVYFYENIGTIQQYSYQFITTNYLAFDNGKYSKPRLVDIDGDEDPDIFSSIGYNILLYRNQGTLSNPNFVYETSNFENITVQSIQPWFSDIDADGDYDLFCGTGAIPGPPGLKLYINQGTPQIPNFVLYSNDLVPGVFTQSSVVISPGTADIDADGDQDLFVSDDDGYFYFFENVGTPSHFQFVYLTNNWQNLFDGFGAHRYFCFYDIDSDGDLDFFYTNNGDSNLKFYRNIGTPQNANIFLEMEVMFAEHIIYQAAPFVTDIDLDGDGDLFIGDTYGGIRFFRNLEIENLPRTLTISVNGNDIILHWEPATRVDQYLIYYQEMPYFTPTGTPQAIVIPPDTSWTDENAVMEGKRYYRVVVEY